jgi:sugar/nucleoside kinase (ribokinase family)
MSKLGAFVNNMDARAWRTIWVSLALLGAVLVVAVIGAVTGIETTADGKADVKACMRAVHVIMDSGTMQLVVAHFPTGAVYLERGREARFSPSVDMPATAIAGANGAGDAFAAGVLYGALKAWPAIEAVRLGHSAAAASLRSVTTTASVVAWPECLELAETLGWRSYSL